MVPWECMQCAGVECVARKKICVLQNCVSVFPYLYVGIESQKQIARTDKNLKL